MKGFKMCEGPKNASAYISCVDVRCGVQENVTDEMMIHVYASYAFVCSRMHVRVSDTCKILPS